MHIYIHFPFVFFLWRTQTNTDVVLLRVVLEEQNFKNEFSELANSIKFIHI